MALEQQIQEDIGEILLFKTAEGGSKEGSELSGWARKTLLDTTLRALFIGRLSGAGDNVKKVPFTFDD